jgi:queuine tRNA-ribosyltransferase
MGVGYPRDILMAVESGVDMFDCVLPTRNGRNGFAFTREGSIRLRNAVHADDPRPIEEGCDCPTCSGGFSRGYLRHLFLASEMLGPTLVSLHNIRLYQRLLLDIRRAIDEDAWLDLCSRWSGATRPTDAATEPENPSDE